MELWIPWSYVVGPALLAFATLLAGFLVPGYTGSQKWLTRAFSVVISVPPALIASILCLTIVSCEAHTPLIGSPDSIHVARVIVWAGSAMTGPDNAQVILRRTWSPGWKVVYSGIGASDVNAKTVFDPRVRWVDDSQVLIEYPDDGAYKPMCLEAAGEIRVHCVAK